MPAVGLPSAPCRQRRQLPAAPRPIRGVRGGAGASARASADQLECKAALNTESSVLFIVSEQLKAGIINEINIKITLI